MKSYVGLAKSELYDQFLSSLDLNFGGRDQGLLEFEDWVLNVVLDGEPFSYKLHEYLIEPYRDKHPFQVDMKAAQMGLTTRAMLMALYKCRYQGVKGVLYLFPSRTDALDFSKSRITDLIDGNRETIGSWIQDTDSAGLRKIWNAFLYVRGMNSKVGLKSIPVDFIIFDELDEAPQDAVDMAMERMAHSKFKQVLQLSNPTLPDYGIDKLFKETDQRYWLIKCVKCNHYTCLEDTFPDCLITLKDGRVIRACEKCKGELNPSNGQWVAKYPGVKDKRGYHYSQLFSHFVDPGEILHKFRTTDNLTDFYNLKIGNAYVEAQNRLSEEEVLALCGQNGIVISDPGPCSMGVDQGRKLHVVVGKRHPIKEGEIIHIGVYESWEELDRLMINMNVQRCVVDALPETRNARAFAERHRGKVYLNYYNVHQKGAYSWNDKELIVQCNRTESLDASHREIIERLIILPRSNKMVQLFATHLHNIAKKLDNETEDPNKKKRIYKSAASDRYVYVKLGPDHFRHAFNYEVMARHCMPHKLFPRFK